MIDYCPNGCVRGWIETDSHVGTACPLHPPFLPGITKASEMASEPAPRPNYHAYLKSEEWKRRRRHSLERHDHRCAVCGSSKRLQVHHLTYDRLGMEDPEDLVPLCDTCHKETHGLLPGQPS